MKTAFETASLSYVQNKCIEKHFSKGWHIKEEIEASIFFIERLMKRYSVEEAKEQTEIAYNGIKVNPVEQAPVKVGIEKVYESWKVYFDYLEEST